MVRPRSGRSARGLLAAMVTGVVMALAPPAGHAAPSVATGAAAEDGGRPTVGAVAFSYQRAPAVTGCSQNTTEDMRDLVAGVVHAPPFAEPGAAARFSLKVYVLPVRAGLLRGTFTLFDAQGAPQGVSVVEDATCDGVHLKLAASIALLLSPRPPAPEAPCPACPPPACDGPCQEAVMREALAAAQRDLRERELPRLRDEVRRGAEERARSGFRAVIGAGGGLGLHFAAEPAPGFWLAAEARSERWSFGLETRALLPTRAFTLSDGRSTLDVASVTGLFVPCVRWRWLGGCALVEAGGLLVTGPGAPDGHVASGVLALGLRARVDVPIALGFEARLFGDAVGHVVGLQLSGDDATGPGGARSPAVFAFDAPRRGSAHVGLGLARAFE